MDQVHSTCKYLEEKKNLWRYITCMYSVQLIDSPITGTGCTFILSNASLKPFSLALTIIVPRVPYSLKKYNFS